MVELRIETQKFDVTGGISGFISQPMLTPEVHNITLDARIVPLNSNSKGASQEVSTLNQALCDLSDLSRDGIINKDILPELRIIQKDKSRKLSNTALYAIQQLKENGINVEY